MKNKIKRSLSVLVAVCVIAALSVAAAPAGKAQAATRKKAALSRKSVSVATGKTRKLTVKNANKKVRWSTTKKKVAYVKKTSGKRRQYAVIKAGKKAGICYIKAKIGTRVLKCKVRVYKNGTGIVKWPPEEIERKIEKRELSGTSTDLTAGLSQTFGEPAETTADFNTLMADFSFNLLKNTIACDPAAQTGNSLVSPDSVLTALAMLENGAAGQTLTEMENTFAPGMTADDFNAGLAAMNNRLISMGKPIYTVANSIWAKKGEMVVNPEFLQKNKNYHNASFFEAPFNSNTVSDMNNWVYNNTRNMIDKIVDLDAIAEAKMVLMNAIAFEGRWIDDEEFSEGATKNEDFTKADGTKQSVPMMNQTRTYQYLKLNGGQGFAKYYVANNGKDNIAFVGLLPPEGVSVDDYLASIKGSDFITAWNSKEPAKLNIKVPKFNYDYSVSMRNVLPAMGMKTAFTDAADFSGMIDMQNSPTKSLMVDDVLHKTHIELDEKGTKAAAVTAVIAKAGSVYDPSDPIPVHLNRPFVYALVDKETGIPLFIGAVRGL